MSPKTVPRLFAFSAILSLTACNSTKPLQVVPPVPSVCFEVCAVNQCTLSATYLELDEEGRADAELRCVKENADSARYCAALKAKCAEGLRKE